MYNQNRKIILLGTISVVIIVIIVGICILVKTNSSPSTYTDGELSSVNSVSSEESEYDHQLTHAKSYVFDLAKWSIADTLKNPDTLSLMHDEDGFTANNAKFTDTGTAKYTDAKGNDVEVPFEICAITTETHYCCLFLKIGDTVKHDYRDYVDDNGRITEAGAEAYGKEAGSNYFDKENGELITVTATPPSTASSTSPPPSNTNEDDGYITLDEYNKINTGMSYQEVCEIIGSNGKELSRVTLAGIENVMIYWEGKGILGANANFTFQNGKMYMKAQFGLN